MFKKVKNLRRSKAYGKKTFTQTKKETAFH
jgi:hypothetical protein